MENHLAARQQADAVLLNYQDLPAADAARLRTVLTTAFDFEDPVRQMNVAINDFGHLYNIIIRGYVAAMDDVLWCNTFFGPNRHDDLGAICNSQTLFPDGARILQMEKVRFVEAVTPAGGDHRAATKGAAKRRFKKRTE